MGNGQVGTESGKKEVLRVKPEGNKGERIARNSVKKGRKKSLNSMPRRRGFGELKEWRGI